MVDLWHAQDGNIWISGTYLPGGSQWTSTVKEISITGGGRDVEGVRCFGSGTNCYINEKAQELIEISLTTVKKDNYLAATVMGGSFTYNANGSTLITGDSMRYPVTMLYTFQDRYSNTGNGFRCKLNSAYCTGKELSLAVDDTMEETFTFKCLPENYQEEFAVNMGSLGLAL